MGFIFHFSLTIWGWLWIFSSDQQRGTYFKFCRNQCRWWNCLCQTTNTTDTNNKFQVFNHLFNSNVCRERSLECVSSDLLDPNTDPDWSRRTKPQSERFDAKYVYCRDDGLQMHFNQTGLFLFQSSFLIFQAMVNMLGSTVWDGGIVLSKYLEWQTAKGNIILKGFLSLFLSDY